MKNIKISFVLLGRKNEVVIFVLTSSVTNGIDRNMIYTILEINNQVKKNYQAKNNI